MFARSARLALVVFALVPVAGAQAAATWTPVPSGTTATITAISPPTAGPLVFVTSNGGISYQTGSTWTAASVTPANASGFTDVAMSPNGVDGVAVGPNGKIYHSIDSGHSWTQITGTMEYPEDCGLASSLAPLSDNLFSVQFADASTVYITGARKDVLKSTSATVSGTTFQEVNKSASGTCKVNPNDSFGDTAWLDANTGYLMSMYFGDIFATVDGFASPLGARKGEAVNSFSNPNALALDPSNNQRMWAVEGGTGCGDLCLQASTDGGTNWAAPQSDIHPVSLRDVSTAGGTVIAVGSGGDIYTSPDGHSFFRQVSGSFPTNDWDAVSLVNATTAYVGGAGGILLVSTTANQIPDTTAPTGTISGPIKLTQSQFGTYTANVADNPGGSGIDPASFVWSTAGLPDQTGHSTASFAFSTVGSHTITVTFKDLAGNQGTASITVNVVAAVTPPPSGSSPVKKVTGGASITIFKKVTVSGRKGRYIPIKLSTKHPRTFVILLELAKKPHTVFVKLTVTVKKGTRTVRLFTPKKVGTGTYRLEIHVRTTGKHSHQVGKSVKQVFVLV